MGFEDISLNFILVNTCNSTTSRLSFVSFSFQIFYLKKYISFTSFLLFKPKSDLLSPSICLKVEQYKIFHLKTQKSLPFSFSSRKPLFFFFCFFFSFNFI